MEKKKMKLRKKILIIILIVVIIFFIITLRKFIILSKIKKLSEEYINKNNFYAEIYSLENNGSITIRKSYNKGSKYLTKIDILGKDVNEIRKLTVYNDQDGQTGIIESGEGKKSILDEDVLGGEITINACLEQPTDFLQKIEFSVLSKITTEEYSYKECYLIEFPEGVRYWVDKETGLILREINAGTVNDFYYEFDTVKDEDIAKPDITNNDEVID